jgi:hypothetical protein
MGGQGGFAMGSKDAKTAEKEPRIVQITAFYDPEAGGDVIYGLDADGEVWVYAWNGEWKRA